MTDNNYTSFPFLKALPKMIEVSVGGHFATYLVSSRMWVYGCIPDLIASIVHRLK